MFDSELAGQASGGPDLFFRVSLRAGDHGQDVIPQFLEGHLEKEGAVHASRESDEHISHPPEGTPESSLFPGR
jgi:hypothetical protein